MCDKVLPLKQKRPANIIILRCDALNSILFAWIKFYVYNFYIIKTRKGAVL